MSARLLLSLSCVALLAACSSETKPPPGPSPSPPVSAAPAPISPEVACDGGFPFSSESPPYRGAGPHRMIGKEIRLQRVDAEYTVYASSPPNLPKSWAAVAPGDPDFTDVWTASSWEDAQLALCIIGPHLTSREPAGKCQIGFDVDVFDATYDFRVIEARTGRMVQNFSLPGTTELCPFSYIAPAGPPSIARAVSDDDLTNRLRPLVEEPAA
jgi:hypothetical protein